MITRFSRLAGALAAWRPRRASQSLLLLGFPRGVTSEAHRIAAEMLPFLDQTEVLDGEILNHQRNPALERPYRIPFWLHPSHRLFERHYRECAELLTAHRDGCLVKDVVQPWIVQRYLAEHPDAYKVLFVDRPLAEVKFALARKEWIFTHRLEAVQAAYRKYPSIGTGPLLEDPQALHQAMRAHYRRARAVDYLDDAFRQRRDEFRERFARGEWDGYLKNISFDDVIELEGFESFNSDIGGAWSTAERASVRVDCSTLLIEPKQLLLRVLAPLNRERAELAVEVELDGQVALQHRFVLPRGIEVLSVPLPPSRSPVRGQRQFEFALRNQELVAPGALCCGYEDGGFDIGLPADDPRPLGVGLIAVGFR